MVHPVRNGDVSFWWSQVRDRPIRPSLDGDLELDVCIVGAGYTGLWTAYYLKRAEPTLRVGVLEARFAGFGASGRNGGWLTNSVTGGRQQYVVTHGRQAAIDQQQAMTDSIDEVISVAAREGIDAHIHRGGELTVARTPSQLARMNAAAKEDARWPGTDVAVLGSRDADARLNVSGTLGALWQPHCARIHPAKLVAGLAEAVERLGVTIYEDTRVTEIQPGRAGHERGVVRARTVLRATEGFTSTLRRQRRTWLPMNSSMIVTDPLPDDVWQEIGWDGRETLGDFAHVYMYAQRTADGRIAFGGRGVPYRFGSRIDSAGATHPRTVRSLTSLMNEFFPSTIGVPIAQTWSGVLGVPRDWSSAVVYDRASGLGWAGGYVGTGVTATNLAGRTLADLALNLDSEITHLPWVHHRSRKWEPEPFRWLGVKGMYAAYRSADRTERSSGSPRTSRIARVADAISGRR